MADYAVRVKDLTKQFVLPHQRVSSVKSRVVSLFKRFDTEKQLAVNGVTVEINKGEFFGIVGRNGSGKSTLLKCIAGVYRPNSGDISVRGTLVPFIELGVGFNPELSGRDNVYLNGALLGFSHKQIDGMYDDIVEFAELGEFMDQALKNYSSGMQVRLAFSIAIRAKGDILLLDEVLAVGDTAFQKKCNDYFYSLKDKDQTVILVTHNMTAVEKFCDRAMILEKGKVLEIGAPAKIADLYNELNLRTSRRELEKQNKTLRSKPKDFRSVRISGVETYNPKTRRIQDTFTSTENIGVRYYIEATEAVKSPVIGLVFRDRNNQKIFTTNTENLSHKIKDLKPNQKLTVEFEVENVFTNATYFVSGAIASPDRSLVYHRIQLAHEFEVGGWKMPDTQVNPRHKIKVTY